MNSNPSTLFSKSPLSLRKKQNHSKKKHPVHQKQKQRICQVCHQNSCPYSCPKCHIQYCSIDCFKSHKCKNNSSSLIQIQNSDEVEFGKFLAQKDLSTHSFASSQNTRFIKHVNSSLVPGDPIRGHLDDPDIPLLSGKQKQAIIQDPILKKYIGKPWIQHLFQRIDNSSHPQKELEKAFSNPQAAFVLDYLLYILMKTPSLPSPQCFTEMTNSELENFIAKNDPTSFCPPKYQFQPEEIAQLKSSLDIRMKTHEIEMMTDEEVISAFLGYEQPE